MMSYSQWSLVKKFQFFKKKFFSHLRRQIFVIFMDHSPRFLVKNHLICKITKKSFGPNRTFLKIYVIIYRPWYLIKYLSILKIQKPFFGQHKFSDNIINLLFFFHGVLLINLIKKCKKNQSTIPPSHLCAGARYGSARRLHSGERFRPSPCCLG